MFKLRCKKIIVPGAHLPRLLSEVALLRQRCTFSHVAVSCGANYVPHPDSVHHPPHWQEQAAGETTALLTYLQDEICPRVSYSQILPQPRGEHLTAEINAVNYEIGKVCCEEGMEEIKHDFFSRHGK